MKYIIIRPSNVYGPRQPYWKLGWYNFCLPGETIISCNFTSKPINSVEVGDRVLTHRGRYSKGVQAPL